MRSKLREVAEFGLCDPKRRQGEAAGGGGGNERKARHSTERERRDAGNFTWRTHNTHKREDKGACFTGLQPETTSKETLVIQGHKSCRCVEDLGTWLGQYPQDLRYSRFDLFVCLFVVTVDLGRPPFAVAVRRRRQKQMTYTQK